MVKVSRPGSFKESTKIAIFMLSFLQIFGKNWTEEKNIGEGGGGFWGPASGGPTAEERKARLPGAQGSSCEWRG